MTAAPRSRAQRLAADFDLWVATAGNGGVPWLIPLSFEWDGETVLMATSETSLTGRNLGRVASGWAWARFGTWLCSMATPRSSRWRRCRGSGVTGCRWFRVTPRRVQAWREENELPGRELMRAGRWLT